MLNSHGDSSKTYTNHRPVNYSELLRFKGCLSGVLAISKAHNYTSYLVHVLLAMSLYYKLIAVQ